MSREFGIYESCGYFHHKIDRAIDDLKWESDKDYTDEIKILEKIYDMCYIIASVEAGDMADDQYEIDKPQLIADLADIVLAIQNKDKMEVL